MPGYASIDCGTNSTRLLAVDEQGKVLARDYVVTRLGQGVDATGALNPAAIVRTAEAIKKFKATIEIHGIDQVSIFATSAARDATNSEQFFRAVEQVLGQRPALLSGVEEGEMTFAGAVVDFDSRLVMVVDIGGGSTELIVGPSPLSAISIDIGAVRITERFLAADPYAEAEKKSATQYIDSMVSDALGRLPIPEPLDKVIAVAGTASSLAMMDRGLSDYYPGCVHRHELDASALHELSSSLLTATQTERLADPTIEPARADVLPAGALILDRIVSQLGVQSCFVSETDNLDGAIASLRGRR